MNQKLTPEDGVKLKLAREKNEALQKVIPRTSIHILEKMSLTFFKEGFLIKPDIISMIAFSRKNPSEKQIIRFFNKFQNKSTNQPLNKLLK